MGKTRVPELVKRVATALVAAPVFLFLMWMGGWYFVLTLMLLTAVIQLEIMNMLDMEGIIIQKTMALFLGVPVLLMAIIPETAWLFILVLLLAVFLIETFSFSNSGWNRLMAVTVAGIMVPAFFSGLLMLRNYGDNATGFILTFTLLLMVWANDIFAFFGGKSMGKHPLAPRISPSKTIEGFIWGVVGSFIALIICQLLIADYPLTWAVSIPFAVIAGLMGPAGDLAESKLKRASGIKDSSALMPGHGGMYDRFDALLFSAPASIVYFRLLGFFSVL